MTTVEEGDGRIDRPERLERFRAAGRRVLRHRLELGFVAFTLIFSALLRFEDSGNLEIFLRASSYLVVGRNPYTILPFPAPPGLFLPVLPAFAVYVASGFSLAWATFSLKVENLVALLILSVAAAHLGSERGLAGVASRRLRNAVLLSPLLFFVSFIWVEQDVIALAITVVGLWAVLRASGPHRMPGQEAAGFGLLAFGAFTYLFPVVLIPTLLAYSKSTAQLLRRLVWTAVGFGGFGIWFLVHPGWELLSNAVGVTGTTGDISVYSILTFLNSNFFGPATALQSTVVGALVVLFVGVELALPVLFRWKGVAWEVSVAVAMTLPFLLLNILNGDEYVWPLPFLWLALLTVSAGQMTSVRLWLVQAYAIPMIVLMNFFDAPGPGAGSGVFYLGYAQFQRGIALSPLIPQLTVVTQTAGALLWGTLLLLLVIVIALDRHGARSPAPGRVESEALVAIAGPESTPSRTGTRRSSFAAGRGAAQRAKRRGPWVGALAVAVVSVTVLASVVPGPTLRASASDEFPVGLFTAYPVANSTVSYSIAPSGNSVSIAPNLGDWTSLPTPWRTVNFSRNIQGEAFGLEVAVQPTAPPLFPYNTTVIAYGSSGLNLVQPFIPPPESSLLLPRSMVNVTEVPAVTSAQLVGNITGAGQYNGSSYADYDATPLSLPGGQVTLLFRWSGVSLLQDVVAYLNTGKVSYELFGEGDFYVAGVKPTLGAPWTFATPRLVNPLSWHEVTLTNETTGIAIGLDSVSIPLPPVSVTAEGPSVNLVLGSAGPYPAEFQRYAFWGTMSGLYNTSGAVPGLGPPLWCTEPLSVGSSQTERCLPSTSSALQIQSENSRGVRVDGLARSVWLNSSEPLFQFGRLSLVGPSLRLSLLSLSISGPNSGLPIVWVIDGTIVAPASLLLLATVGRPPRPPTRQPAGSDAGDPDR